MRSIRANANSGSVSHVSKAVSHSLGPREPNSAVNAANSSTNVATGRSGASSGSIAPCSRDMMPETPRSNSAVRVVLAATERPSAHIARDGAAESTSPIPDMSRVAIVGSPSALEQLRRAGTAGRRRRTRRRGAFRTTTRTVRSVRRWSSRATPGRLLSPGRAARRGTPRSHARHDRVRESRSV